jgi:hypothetical protein
MFLTDENKNFLNGESTISIKSMFGSRRTSMTIVMEGKITKIAWLGLRDPNEINFCSFLLHGGRLSRVFRNSAVKGQQSNRVFLDHILDFHALDARNSKEEEMREQGIVCVVLIREDPPRGEVGDEARVAIGISTVRKLAWKLQPPAPFDQSKSMCVFGSSHVALLSPCGTRVWTESLKNILDFKPRPRKINLDKKVDRLWSDDHRNFIIGSTYDEKLDKECTNRQSSSICFFEPTSGDLVSQMFTGSRMGRIAQACFGPSLFTLTSEEGHIISY